MKTVPTGYSIVQMPIGAGGITVAPGAPYTALTLDGLLAEFMAAIPAALTIEDEGTPLATAADTLDFVGAGVTASGTGASKTITIPGTPVGTAGGDLSGTYPNPTVVDDSHSHTAATAPGSGSDMHGHVDNVVFSGDGATTVFTLPVAPVDATSVAVYVAGARSPDWTLSGVLLDTLTFGSAPPSAANNIVIDITAALA